MKRSVCLLLSSVILLAAACGCGYRIGARTMMHPQIKTLAVADVKNDTLEPLAAGILRSQLAEQFQRDGAVELKQIGEADCVCYAKIVHVKNETIREDSYSYDITYRPAQFRLTVTVEFQVLIPGNGTPLVARRQVTGHADYQQLNDINVNRSNALRYACLRAAKMVVEYTTEAW